MTCQQIKSVLIKIINDVWLSVSVYLYVKYKHRDLLCQNTERPGCHLLIYVAHAAGINTVIHKATGLMVP